MRRGANVYLLDQVRKRLSFTDTLTAFTAMAARWPQSSKKLVESAANGVAVIDSLKGKIPGIIAVTPKESKYARANAVAPFLEAGNVFLPAPDIALFDAEELVTEASSFPAEAHDDMVDATSQALAVMLLDSSGAQAWISWVRRKAIENGGLIEDPATGEVAPPAEIEPPARGAHASRRSAPEPVQEPALEGVVLDPVAARKRARDERFRESPDGIMLRYLNGG
jgi:predicted phage terminase large subunit-like protein